MEAIDDTACFRERRPDNPTHGVRQVKRDLLDGVATLLSNPSQDGDNVLHFCARNDGDQGPLPCVRVTVGHERVQLTVGK